MPLQVSTNNTVAKRINIGVCTSIDAVEDCCPRSRVAYDIYLFLFLLIFGCTYTHETIDEFATHTCQQLGARLIFSQLWNPKKTEQPIMPYMKFQNITVDL